MGEELLERSIEGSRARVVLFGLIGLYVRVEPDSFCVGGILCTADRLRRTGFSHFHFRLPGRAEVDIPRGPERDRAVNEGFQISVRTPRHVAGCLAQPVEINVPTLAGGGPRNNPSHELA